MWGHNCIVGKGQKHLFFLKHNIENEITALDIRKADRKLFYNIVFKFYIWLARQNYLCTGVYCSLSAVQRLPGSLSHHSEAMGYHTGVAWTSYLLHKEVSTQSKPPIDSSHRQYDNQGLIDTAEPQLRMNWDLMKNMEEQKNWDM